MNLKKKIGFISTILAMLLMACIVAGCSSPKVASEDDPSDPGVSIPENTVITVTHYEWYAMEGYEPKEITEVFESAAIEDIIYTDGNYELKIEKISSDKVVISSLGGLIEENEDGTINLNADAPYTFTIHNGEELKLASQSMDAGVNITIKFEIAE